jgi:hypothetical protein
MLADVAARNLAETLTPKPAAPSEPLMVRWPDKTLVSEVSRQLKLITRLRSAVIKTLFERTDLIKISIFGWITGRQT